MRHAALVLGGHFLELTPCPAPQDTHQSNPDHPSRRLTATGTFPGPTSTFERIELPHGRIALRTLDGSYLSCQPDDGHSFGVYASPTLGPREVFEEVLWPDGLVSLRTCELTYLTAWDGGGGKVMANRIAPGAWERFALQPVQLTVPEQATPESSAARERAH